MATQDIDALLDRARRLVSSHSGEALALAGQARELAVAEGLQGLQAAALVVEAHAMTMFGQQAEALDALLVALDLGDHHGMGLARGDALQMLARVYYTRGEYERASDCWCACVELEDADIAPTVRIRAHVGLGQLLYAHEQYDSALAHHRRALVLAEESDDPQLTSSCLINIAVDLMRLGLLSDAIASLKQALPLVRADKNYEYEAEIYSVLGQIDMARGDIERARMSLMVALKINRLHVNSWGEASNLLWLGQCSLAEGLLETADDELRSALALAQSMGSQHLLANAHHALATLCRSNGQTEIADKHELSYRELRRQLLEHARSPRLATMELRLSPVT
ncbi:tetratricopeptide repeat protein [Silvimonas soli]|uniref:tetratricopeptide repeat protein n=1 Tax=Silvimonas soli TaxID=2980100 RepID=UPI0024B3213C|nr:tetratricopeptide repeat protein [Silvimonas soli]